MLVCLIPEDIPSDAEAEARLHESEHKEAPHEDDKEEESLGMASSFGRYRKPVLKMYL